MGQGRPHRPVVRASAGVNGAVEMSFAMIKARIAEDQTTIGAMARACPSSSRPRCASSARTASKPRSSTFPSAASWPRRTADFEVGSRVWLMLPGRERANAVVKWTAGDKLGAEFAEPISLEGLAALQRLIGGSARFVVSFRSDNSSRPAISCCNRARVSLVGACEGRKFCNADHFRAKPGSLQERGYHAVYREHEVNHCPGCGRTHWLIGRMSAECAFCATALPLAEASMRSHQRPGDHPAQEPRRATPGRRSRR